VTSSDLPAPSLVRVWECVDTNFDEVAGSPVLSLDGIADAFRDRTERIAFARNCYLLALRRRLSLGAKCDLLIVADMGPNEDLIYGPRFEVVAVAHVISSLALIGLANTDALSQAR
jgi:hypothetical protein